MLASAQAEDVTLDDGRVVREASIKAPAADGRRVVHGKDLSGIDYATCVPIQSLPLDIQFRLVPVTEQPAPESTPAREPIEISNLEVVALDTSGGVVSYSWSVKVSNNTSNKIALRSRVKLLTKDGKELAQEIGGYDAIKAFGSETLTGHGEVKESLWKQKGRAEVVTLP